MAYQKNILDRTVGYSKKLMLKSGDGASVSDYYRLSEDERCGCESGVKVIILEGTHMKINDKIGTNVNINVMNKNETTGKISITVINTGVYLDRGASASFSGLTVIGGSNNDIQINTENTNKLHDIISQIEILSNSIDTDRDDIALEVAKIKAELKRDRLSKVIKSAFNSLKGIFSNIALGVASNIINDLIEEALKCISCSN